MLHQFAAALFRKVNQDVHAENYVHFSDVHAVGQVHLNEIDHFAEARANLLAAVARLKVGGELFFADAANAAAGIDSAFGNGQRLTPDVSSKNLDVPRVRKRNRIGNGDGNGIRLFTGGATSTPDAQRARILPELSDVQLGKDPFFEGFEDTGITKERCFLSE